VPVKYLSVSEAAARKGVSRSAIYAAIARGRLSAERIAGHWVLREKEVDTYTPIPNDQRAGMRLGGRRRAQQGSEGKRPRGRPRKTSTEGEGQA
jgi:excisionase family DNA binding protein